MTRSYSRLAKVQERKNLRQAFLYVILTIIFGGVLIFFGLTIMAKLANFFIDLNDTDVIEQTDTTPPAPPRLSNIPEATNREDLELQGNTEAGATVKIYYNEETKELIADSSGNFSTTLKLKKGENLVFVKSTDTAGNESQESKRYTVVFDNEKPKIEIIKPADGEKFFGSKQKQITIEGQTESGSSVTINDRLVILDGNGKFNFPATLGDGDTPFNIKSTDEAGNLSELTVTYHYSP